jgi:isoleucyl-tRNA synthetase
VAFHPDFDYVAFQPGAPGLDSETWESTILDQPVSPSPQKLRAPSFPLFSAERVGAQDPNLAPVYIVAAALADQVAAACQLGPTSELARFKGAVLDRITFQHPFLDRSVLGVLATYVTADQGTGAVHTAPAHGADDFYTGQRYGLDPTCRVDASGRLYVDPDAWDHTAPPAFEGLKVWAANPIILAMLEERGALLANRDLEHSYPHCWRCHKPVIYRATEQWFIGMETPVKRADGSETTFRQLAIEEIDKVVWDPAWGKVRITNMIATRPDWCISRQKIWDVPIAVFLCQRCNRPIVSAELNRAVVGLIERQGIDALAFD